MKVLWIVNLLPRDISKKLNIASENLGGWVESMAGELKKFNDIQLAIACKCSADLSFHENVNGIEYFSVPYSSATALSEIENICQAIIENYHPDIIQIEGTEFLHAKAMLTVAKAKKIPTVVSLQGILNGQYQYQCGQLQIDDMMFSRSFKKFFTAWILHLRKTRWYKKRMGPEAEITRMADHVMGRTTWDRAHAYRINPSAKYYTCNRTLRTPFYEKHWSIDTMERHSVYIGNGYYALKGLHFVVQALPELIREYPDIKVYVAGVKPFYEGDKRPFYKKGYGLYLEKLIKDLGVEDHIIFTGSLKAEEVADRLSKVHAYVLCSAVENSPNTLGEAMLLGTPCVAAYVGGVSDMATDGESALFYRNDDPALLAWNLKRVFDDDQLALKLSENGRKRALITHDPQKNAEQLIENYKDILNLV